MFQEFEKIGLIERKVQGLGKPTRIYVKHFNRMVSDSENVSEHQEVRKSNTNHTNINHTEFSHTEVNQTAAEATDRAIAKNSIEKSLNITFINQESGS